jgi:predicted DNA-binding WGR domain protein
MLANSLLCGTFTETFPSDPYTLAGAISNKGTLNGSLDVDGIPLSFRSSTTATISVLFPGAFTGLPLRKYSGGVIVDSCLLNGPFDSTHYYFQWDSPGFDVSIFSGAIQQLPIYGRLFPLEHLTYWVDLNNMGLSPESNSLDAVIQGAESYLHTELTRYFVLPKEIGAIPISASDISINISQAVCRHRYGGRRHRPGSGIRRMSAVTLKRTDPARRISRFYLVAVQPDLFGEWCLMREWGRIGRPGQARIVSYATQEEAEAAFNRHRRIKERLGYR